MAEERTLILHSREGVRLKADEQRLVFQFEPAIRLPHSDFQLGVQQFTYESDSLQYTIDASFDLVLGPRRRRVPILIHCGNVEELVTKLNETMKAQVGKGLTLTAVDAEERPLTVVLRTAEHAVTGFAPELLKILGFEKPPGGGRIQFPPKGAYEADRYVYLPPQIEFYVVADCVQADTRVHNSQLLPVILQCSSNSETVDSVNQEPQRVKWTRVNKSTIQRLTVAFHHTAGGEVVHCRPWLNDWHMVCSWRPLPTTAAAAAAAATSPPHPL